MNRDKLVIILGAALFISLSTNLFVAGIMLGRSYNHGGAPEHAKEEPRAEWQKRDEELRSKLSEPDRAIVKSAMQQRRPQFQALRQALEAAHDKVLDAQGAEPFNKAALDAALHDEAEKKTALVQSLRQARDEVGGQLSPEGRALFNKLGPGARFGEGRRRGGDGDGNDRRPDRDGRGPGFGNDQGGPPPEGALPPANGQNGPVPQP